MLDNSRPETEHSVCRKAFARSGTIRNLAVRGCVVLATWPSVVLGKAVSITTFTQAVRVRPPVAETGLKGMQRPAE